MNNAPNMYGKHAPNMAATKTSAEEMSMTVSPVSDLYAASKANEVKTADPMANPFPVPAVVFPKAYLSSSAISAV